MIKKQSIFLFFTTIAAAGFVWSLVALQAQTAAPHEYKAGNQAPAIAGGADYYAILDLDARFAFALDSDADHGQAFADLFLPDGAYVGANGHEVKGSAALAAFAENAAELAHNRRHFTINVWMQKAVGGLRQWSYLLVTSPAGDKEGVTDGGQYWDDLVRTPKGWRIKKRTFLAPGTPRPEASSVFTLQAPAPAEAPQHDKNELQGGLSAMDRAEIMQLYAHYPYALDKVLDHGQMFADLFTADGTMTTADGSAISGRSALAEYVMRRGLTETKTYITNVMLDETAEGVEARSYVMEASEPQIPAPATIGPVGMFVDQIVRTPEGWRFRHKSIVPFAKGLAHIEPTATNSGAHTAKSRPTSRGGSLTADDYAAIQQLYARYAHGFDSKVDNGAMYLSVFTTTGRFTDQYNKVADGFSELDKTYAHSQTGQPNPISVGHSTWSLMVDPAPWGAAGRSYTGGGRVNATNASPLVPGLLGEYLDMIVRTSDGWRFEHRTFRQDFQIPVGRVGGGRRPAEPAQSTR